MESGEIKAGEIKEDFPEENQEVQLLNNAFKEIQQAGELPHTLCLQKSWEGFQVSQMLNKCINDIVQNPKILPEIGEFLQELQEDPSLLVDKERYQE
ncbi:hypothetical protein HON22_00195, partial [Candidatus Peregrinibacteria bacterium]|nr:hypothetical protein [Candidatus Peregrinibacteria bacterium]